MKAADISDERFMEIVLTVFEERDMWTSRWDAGERMPEFPEKIVLAKARQLLKRGLLRGCGCGCRGDFEIETKGMAWMLERGTPRARLKRYARARAIPFPDSIHGKEAGE